MSTPEVSGPSNRRRGRGSSIGSASGLAAAALRASRIRRSSARPSLVSSVRLRPRPRPAASAFSYRPSRSSSVSSPSGDAGLLGGRLRGRVDSPTGSVFGRGGPGSTEPGPRPGRTVASSTAWARVCTSGVLLRRETPDCWMSMSTSFSAASSWSWAITSWTTTRMTFTLGQRSSGSKARARSTSSIRGLGKCGASEASERGGLRATASSRSMIGPVDGCTVSPASARNIVAAIDHMSLRESRFWLSARACSGAI